MNFRSICIIIIYIIIITIYVYTHIYKHTYILDLYHQKYVDAEIRSLMFLHLHLYIP